MTLMFSLPLMLTGCGGGSSAASTTATTGTTAPVDPVAPVPVTSPVTYALAAGYDHSVAIRSDGTLWSWGDNSVGQLGTLSGVVAEPRQVISTTTFSATAAGFKHTLALKSDGTLWSWGDNTFGQLGVDSVIPNTTFNKTPVQVMPGTTFIAIAAGQNHSLAIRTDGALWAWGDNSSGQLGDGTKVNRAAPVAVAAGSTFISVAAHGGFHSLAIKTDGSLWGWGFNFSGQVGDGTTTTRFLPVKVGTDLLTRSIATGIDFSMAIKKDGSLSAWGNNAKGQLGDGTTVSQLAAIKIGTGYTNVAAGEKHAVALKTDGTLWSWGDNASGQLGDGTTVSKLVPTKIGANFTGITAGQFHALGIKNDGSLWGWGYSIAKSANGNLGLVQIAASGYK